MVARTQQWLVHKSAYQRLGDTPDVDLWLGRLQRVDRDFELLADVTGQPVERLARAF